MYTVCKDLRNSFCKHTVVVDITVVLTVKMTVPVGGPLDFLSRWVFFTIPYRHHD